MGHMCTIEVVADLYCRYIMTIDVHIELSIIINAFEMLLQIKVIDYQLSLLMIKKIFQSCL